MHFYYYWDKDQKEIDLIYTDGNILYPVETKKGINPNAPDKNFSVISKYSNNIGNGIIICLTKTLQPIKNNCALSIEYI